MSATVRDARYVVSVPTEPFEVWVGTLAEAAEVAGRGAQSRAVSRVLRFSNDAFAGLAPLLPGERIDFMGLTA